MRPSILQSSFKQKQGSAPSAVPSHYHSPVVKAAVDQWELHPSMVVVERRLGEGAFGTVYEGTAQGMAHPAPPSSASSSAMPKVAVKLLSGALWASVVSLDGAVCLYLRLCEDKARVILLCTSFVRCHFNP